MFLHSEQDSQSWTAGEKWEVRSVDLWTGLSGPSAGVTQSASQPVLGEKTRTHTHQHEEGQEDKGQERDHQLRAADICLQLPHHHQLQSAAKVSPSSISVSASLLLRDIKSWQLQKYK